MRLIAPALLLAALPAFAADPAPEISRPAATPPGPACTLPPGEHPHETPAATPCARALQYA